MPATSPAPDRAGAALLLGFGATLALALVAYVTLFDADATVEKVVLGTLVALGLAAMAVVHRRLVPAGQLPRPQRLRRERRRTAALTGGLGALLVVLGWAALGDLGSWGERVVLGVLVVFAIGTGLELQIGAIDRDADPLLRR